MTGQELIKKIEKENLQDRHLFIDVEGYISPVCEVLETKSGDIILTQEGRGIDDLYDKDNLERYFSEWFKIIPKEEAERKAALEAARKAEEKNRASSEHARFFMQRVT